VRREEGEGKALRRPHWPAHLLRGEGLSITDLREEKGGKGKGGKCLSHHFAESCRLRGGGGGRGEFAVKYFGERKRSAMYKNRLLRRLDLH